eukprot:scaffold1113_cov379-Prasinococcus_capsulatus_cf.AAC.8
MHNLFNVTYLIRRTGHASVDSERGPHLGTAHAHDEPLLKEVRVCWHAGPMRETGQCTGCKNGEIGRHGAFCSLGRSRASLAPAKIQNARPDPRGRGSTVAHPHDLHPTGAERAANTPPL